MGKKTETTDATESTGKGRIVTFDVKGVSTKRVDYIRDRYYGKNGVHEEGDPTRSEILKEVRELQGDPDLKYQIIFAASKTDVRPVAKVRGKKAEETPEAAAAE